MRAIARFDHARGGTWRPVAELRTFDTFVLDEKDRLLRALCLITGSRSSAEDIAQEAFTRVFERWDAVNAMDSPEGYLHRTAMNVFRSDLRRAKRALKRVMIPGDTADVFAAIDDRDEATRVLATLSPRQRAAIVLTEGLGYSGNEAGDLLGIKGSTVHALTHQARASLTTIRREAPDD